MVSPHKTQAPPQTSSHSGWYSDPWGVAQWRWWDGHMWTAYLQTSTIEKKPRIPAAFSVPVILGSVVTVPAVLFMAFIYPLAVVLGLVPLLVVLPVLAWLDRVEPEPRSSQVHALLWGACVAALLSGIVNTLVAITVGEDFATVVSAPVIEELTKGLAIYWAVRRREVDSVMDGLVYAGWAALGFAVVENFLYFSDAAAVGTLAEVFFLRAFLTPFAHPLFTSWTGLAIGWAVSNNKAVPPYAAAGYLVAILSHAAWNGSLVYSATMGDGGALLFAALCFVALFLVSVVAVSIMRNRSVAAFERSVPALAQRYGLSPQEILVFGNWRQLLQTRRSLPRTQRKKFDQVHTALARLSALHSRPGKPNPVDVQVLANQLYTARNTR